MTLNSFYLKLPFNVKGKKFVNVFLEGDVVSSVEFSSSPVRDKVDSRGAEKLREGLKKYFQGYKIDFKDYSVRLEARTNFLQKVLEEARNIPYGETLTYGEFASRMNTGPRAIGQAMKKNPVPLIIPCHRVVASNGLGGYSSGVEIKKELLKLESSPRL